MNPHGFCTLFLSSSPCLCIVEPSWIYYSSPPLTPMTTWTLFLTMYTFWKHGRILFLVCYVLLFYEIVTPVLVLHIILHSSFSYVAPPQTVL
jgi:hypothetical protein